MNIFENENCRLNTKLLFSVSSQVLKDQILPKRTVNSYELLSTYRFNVLFVQHLAVFHAHGQCEYRILCIVYNIQTKIEELQMPFNQKRKKRYSVRSLKSDFFLLFLVIVPKKVTRSRNQLFFFKSRSFPTPPACVLLVQ